MLFFVLMLFPYCAIFCINLCIHSLYFLQNCTCISITFFSSFKLSTFKKGKRLMVIFVDELSQLYWDNVVWKLFSNMNAKASE